MPKEEPVREKMIVVAEKVFFAAMLDGYLGERKKSIKSKTPDGYTTITFVDEKSFPKFKLVDRYCEGQRPGSSAGTTTIFFENKAIWWMSYKGFYYKEIIPFLKECLRENYQKEYCYGCRGPHSKIKGNLLYINIPTINVGFPKFEGTEEVCRIENGKTEILGNHHYFGGLL